MAYTSKFKGKEIDELLEKVQLGQVEGNSIPIVDSIDKLDNNAPVGTLSSVATQEGLKETKLSEVLKKLPDAPSMDSQEGLIEYLNNSPIVNKVNIFAPRVIPEEALYFIIFLAGGIDSLMGGGQGKVIIMGVTKSVAACEISLSQNDQRAIEIFSYDNASQTYVLNNEGINELNTILASDDFKYMGDILASVIGKTKQEDLDVIDTFISLYINHMPEADLYIKKEKWIRAIEPDIQKIYTELKNKISIPEINIGFTLTTGGLAESNVLYAIQGKLNEQIIKLNIDINNDFGYKEFMFYFPNNKLDDLQFLDKNETPLEIKWANDNYPIFETNSNYFISIVTFWGINLGVFVEFV